MHCRIMGNNEKKTVIITLSCFFAQFPIVLKESHCLMKSISSCRSFSDLFSINCCCFSVKLLFDEFLLIFFSDTCEVTQIRHSKNGAPETMTD